jgi:hypothetical protein
MMIIILTMIMTVMTMMMMMKVLMIKMKMMKVLMFMDQDDDYGDDNDDDDDDDDEDDEEIVWFFLIVLQYSKRERRREQGRRKVFKLFLNTKVLHTRLVNRRRARGGNSPGNFPRNSFPSPKEKIKEPPPCMEDRNVLFIENLLMVSTCAVMKRYTAAVV